MDGTARVTVVVVTLDALPWIERCLESVRGHELIVVDHGSTDGTLELLRERFPDVRLIEQENKGLGGGSNAGMRVASGDYFLLLNSDAWAVENALERLVEFAEEHPDAAIVGPRLSNPDGSLQPSVRGFPTLWRLATEYLFLRKLAPRTRMLNAFYGAGFSHDRVLEAEFVMGACLLVRREAADTVGLFDEDFFMFSEETDWCYRFRQAGWKVLFFPGAEFVHVGGASTRRNWGPMFREQVRGHVRFLAKHRGRREAERARRLLLASLRLRGLAFPGERGRTYGAAARWLARTPLPELLEGRA
ncbi:MAG TPA: glycosyltransferase family 2 protein [Gaiellaceae bacterium]|nr:glycosyltransferase family 2 protein [Gaiellaceae bacterium]